MATLTAKNLAKAYKGRRVVEDVSLTVNSGEIVGLLGPNGAGKTTTFYMVVGIVPRDAGNIIIDDDDISLLPLHARARRGIGYLPQAPAYDPEKTVLEQAVSYLWPEVAAEGDYRCKSMLNQLEITDFDAKMGTLSGGERKRVAMAGILTNPCDILILDEPTNHIDADTVEWLENYLQKFRGAIFMVTHDRYFLDRVTNVILELTGGNLYRHGLDRG